MRTEATPAERFAGFLWRHGFTLRIDERGRLAVKPPPDYALVEPLRGEIQARASALRAILEPDAPDGMRPYVGRLLPGKELGAALVAASHCGAHVATIPVDGGWIVRIVGMSPVKAVDPDKESNAAPGNLALEGME